MNHEESEQTTTPSLQSVNAFSQKYPEFPKGGLRWFIFNKREELIEAQVICYWGRRVLINPPNFFRYVMEGGAQTKK
ncbi:MAG: hypothetical protein CMQ12_09280 [Gammaproteobacteria bacterium]|nr:hypothetical protein [Gammaproteobacteria bacterium]